MLKLLNFWDKMHNLVERSIYFAFEIKKTQNRKGGGYVPLKTQGTYIKGDRVMTRENAPKR